MREYADRIRREVGTIIVGQQDVLDQVLMCIIAGGHALLIGLPGMAKTLMVRTLATVLNLEFKRVQFTPDLMPTDIVGTDVLETNQTTGEKEFRFIRGPLFCNLLLADEINRTPPKTQAALLEAMQEKRVTAGNTTYTLEEPFFVLATQNPIEMEGTYPLPEAQLDRFLLKVLIAAPSEDELTRILARTTGRTGAQPERVVRLEELQQALVREEELEAANRACRIELAAQPGQPVVGDPELLRTAVENVLRNAIRYAPAGSAVTVTLARDGAWQEVRVADRGPGVPEAFLERIFEPYLRVPDGTEGTGLGLAIARRALEMHGGSIDARLREGGGLEVRLRLPAAELG